MDLSSKKREKRGKKGRGKEKRKREGEKNGEGVSEEEGWRFYKSAVFPSVCKPVETP